MTNITQPLNSLHSMLSLGHQPKIRGQCKQNLRFINQESSNSTNRYTLRRAFGNQLFNVNRTFVANVFLINDNNRTYFYKKSVDIHENNIISQFNSGSKHILFDISNNTNDTTSNLPSLVQTLTRATVISNSTNITNIIIQNYPYINSSPGNNIISNHTISNSPINGAMRINVSYLNFSFNSGLTPFRKAFNAGDMFTQNNSATSHHLPPAPNQINSLRNIFGWQNQAGSVRQELNGSFYSGNPKFIYDSSDYARFKKLQAINKNYNDNTFGGDQHHASQTAYTRVIKK